MKTSKKEFLLKISILFLGCIIILIIFHAWFIPGNNSSGDLDYVWEYNFFKIFPYTWNISKDYGLGIFYAPFLWVYTAQSFPIAIFGNLLKLPWEITQKIIFFYPFIILSTLSPILLYKKTISSQKIYYLAALVYLGNTYILNIIQGGQLILALAYGLTPITILLYIQLITAFKNKYRKSIIAGLILSLQLLLDIRITYIVIMAILLYFFLYLITFKIKRKEIVKKLLFIFFIPAIITILLHAFWLLPLITYQQNPIAQLGSAYNATQSVSFLSFAKFENTLSLLHPNWPENIFGKTYFMKWEFLFLPMLAYASLLFLKNKKKEKNKQHLILFFALLGLIGGFLAKGTNEPFGTLYIWMFNHIPGFVMFRDSTKFYILIALSYSILIPFSVSEIYIWLKSKPLNLPKYSANIFLIAVIAYVLFLIRPALTGQLNGTLKSHPVPQEYKKLETFLVNKNQFFRTLWFPVIPAYAYYSNNHPSIAAQELLNTYDNKKLLKMLANPKTKELLEEASIKYVILPYDSEKQIFLRDRKYDEGLYQATSKSLQKISWLHKKVAFNHIQVFELTNAKAHIWSPNKNTTIAYSYNNPTKYTISIKNAKKGENLIFSEKYDSLWQLSISGQTISGKPFHKNLISFTLPQNGTINGIIHYSLQPLANIGFIISITSLILSLGLLFTNI